MDLYDIWGAGEFQTKMELMLYMFERNVVQSNISLLLFQNRIYPDYSPSNPPDKPEKRYEQLAN